MLSAGPVEPYLDAGAGVLMSDPGVRLSVVAAPGLRLTGPLAAAARVVAAAGPLPPDLPAARAVRASRSASPRVATMLLRDGLADAAVTGAPAATAAAAAEFSLARLPGAGCVVLARLRPGPGGPQLLVSPASLEDRDPGSLVVCAVAGAACLRALGTARPSVGLLWPGGRLDATDSLRRRALDALADLDRAQPGSVGPVGLCEPAALDGAAAGGPEVVVTDEVSAAVAQALLPPPPGGPGGVLVLGLTGLVVAAADPGAAGVGRALELAAAAVRGQVVAQVAAGFAQLVTRRRAAAGFDRTGPVGGR